MRVLVTGGAGYSGSVLTRHLVSAGHQAIILDTFEYGVHAALQSLRGVEFVRGDVADRVAVYNWAEQCDAIMHLASVVGAPACAENERLARETIIEGTTNVCRAADSMRIPLINASTGSVYGKVENLCTEDTPCNPQSLYGKLKLQAEQMVAAVGGVNLRFATLCGVSPVMRFDLLPNDFVWRAIKDRYIVIYQGSDRRTFLSVDDAARAYLAVLEKYNSIRVQAFNVGSEQFNLTKLALARKVCEQFPFEIVEQPVGTDPDLRDYAVGYEKLRQATGFSPQDSLEQVIRDVGAVARVASGRGLWRKAM